MNVAQRDPNTSAEVRDELRKAANNAADNRDMSAYWHAWLFLIGSIVLVLGLLWVGFTGKGAERIVCLIMIAIITFSLYVGGMSWRVG